MTSKNIFYNKVGQHPLIGKRIRISFISDPYTHLKDGDLGIVTDINECDYGNDYFTFTL